jgi:protein-S-isoprenylcysteine O-methyltransferase Ste14
VEQQWFGLEQQFLEKEKPVLDLKKWFNPKHYNRLWNVGPIGALATGLSNSLILAIDAQLDLAKINMSGKWTTILTALIIIDLLIVLFWILFSLPPKDRGKTLSKKGIYAFIRHPVYTTLIYHFPIIFALNYKSFLLLFFVPIYHFFWSKLVVKEEEYLVGIFGQDYVDYMREVPRFIPWR